MNTNDSPSSCPQCDGPIPAEAREGLCPRCALAAVAAATETERPGEPPPIAPTREAVAAALPQFEILEWIGQGGMGCVFKARQPQLDRLVALKILPTVPGREPKFTERFLREAKALARMSHPNIVTVHDSGQAGGFFYLVMEFVDGVSLRQLLRERRLAPEEALAIVPRICEALQFAHEQGVVHRDIKPENVLLDKQGRVKIADFGIAKLVGGAGPGGALTLSTDVRVPPAESAAPVDAESALTQGHVLGTPNYMAPEQVDRPGMVDHRADIYSLGVVFYEMLTGELPTGAFQPPSSKVQIDVRLDEVVLRALEQKPELRYQQASEVKSQVERITSTPPDRVAPGHNPSLDPGQLNPAPPGTAPWVALGVTVTYAGTLLFGLLGTVLRGGVPGSWVVAAFAILGCASPFLVWALRSFIPAEGHRTVFKVGAGLAFVTALPIVGFVIFFLMALMGERGGWNPARDEAVLVPLIWLGAVLLPGCGWWLARGVTRPGRDPADANPLPALQLEPASERSRAVRASDRPIFAAIAVAAMLLLTASGNATVMLIGSAVLLVVGLVWLPMSRWRIALLVALASMGVAGFTVLFLNTHVQRARMEEVYANGKVTVRSAILSAKVRQGRWGNIVIHHSGTESGNVEGMDEYHRKTQHMENGLAYHFVIGNGRGMEDGEIAVGQRWKEQINGGHLASESLNANSIGICLVGNFDKHKPTINQLASLEALLHALRDRCNLEASAVKTHQQINPGYTRCPGKHFPTATVLKTAETAHPDLSNHRRRPVTAGHSPPPTTETTQTNAPVPAPELTVASDGSGTHESIQAALNDAVEGTVIRIGPGRYEDPLLITKSVSLIGAGWSETVIGPATPVAPPTPQERKELDRQFRAARTDEERNRLRTEARDRFFKPVVQVRNAAKVSFEGIKFTLPGSPPEGTLQDSCVIEIGEAQARFDACAVVGSPGNGIVLSDGADLTLSNTLVAAAWNTGIRVESGTASHLTVVESDIRNCHYAGIVIGRGQNDVTIKRCRVSGAAWHGIRYDHASPTISGNLLFANARSGIYASGVTAARVQGNVFWKNEMNGMSCWFENRDGITNNTFAANLREGLSVLGASNPAIERNIFWQHPQGIVQGNIGDNSTSAKAAASLRLQNNLFWANEVNITSALDLPPGDTNEPASISIETLPGNVEADPGFRDAANGDFSWLPNGAAATLGNGAQSALQPIGPWPLQPEEQAIIPEGDTRDSRQWKRTL